MEAGRKMEQTRHQMSIIVMYDHSLTFQPESNIFANLGKEDQKKVRQVCAQAGFIFEIYLPTLAC